MPTFLWPLLGQTPLFPDEPGKFAALRTHEIHTGVDVYTGIGQAVVSMEDGVVIGIEQTPLLRAAAGPRAVDFDIGLYDGARFRDLSAPANVTYAFGNRLSHGETK